MGNLVKGEDQVIRDSEQYPSKENEGSDMSETAQIQEETAVSEPVQQDDAETGKSVSDYLGNGEYIVYVNVMNRLSIDCDCDGNPAEPDMHDIGILASTDPVALDQACITLVYVWNDSSKRL